MIAILIYKVLDYIGFDFVFNPIKESFEPWQILLGGLISLLIFGWVLFSLHGFLDKKIEEKEKNDRR